MRYHVLDANLFLWGWVGVVYGWGGVECRLRVNECRQSCHYLMIKILQKGSLFRIPITNENTVSSDFVQSKCPKRKHTTRNKK